MLAQWDFFIAYSNLDVAAADELFNHLAIRARVFLDHKSLSAGVEWDREVPRAQRSSRITVVLVSDNSEQALYQRAEVQAAINMARRTPEQHRVIPVYLRGRAVTTSDHLYGLSVFQGLFLEELGEMRRVALELLGLLEHSAPQQQLTVAEAIEAVTAFYGEAPANGPFWYRVCVGGRWIPTGMIGYPHWTESRDLEAVTFSYKPPKERTTVSTNQSGLAEAARALETLPGAVQQRCRGLQDWYFQRGETLWNEPAYVVQFRNLNEASKILSSQRHSQIRLIETGWALYRLGCGLVLDELAVANKRSELTIRRALFPTLAHVVRGYPTRIGGVNVLTALAIRGGGKVHWRLGFARRSAANAVFPRSLTTVPSGTHAPTSSDHAGGAALAVSVWREFAEEFNFTRSRASAERRHHSRDVPYNSAQADPYWYVAEYDALTWFFKRGPLVSLSKPDRVATRLTAFAISAVNGLYGFNVLMCVRDADFHEAFRIQEHWETAKRITIDTTNRDHSDQIAELLTGRDFAPPAIPALVEGLKALKKIDQEQSNTLQLPDIRSEFGLTPA